MKNLLKRAVGLAPYELQKPGVEERAVRIAVSTYISSLRRTRWAATKTSVPLIAPLVSGLNLMYGTDTTEGSVNIGKIVVAIPGVFVFLLLYSILFTTLRIVTVNKYLNVIEVMDK